MLPDNSSLLIFIFTPQIRYTNKNNDILFEDDRFRKAEKENSVRIAI
jgi:hypothetical protein